MATRLGEKLHELRKQCGLTLEKSAELAGLSKSYLWELKTANPSDLRRKSSRHWPTYGKRWLAYFLGRGCARPRRASSRRGFFPRLSEARARCERAAPQKY